MKKVACVYVDKFQKILCDNLLNQSEFARQMGVSRSYASLVATGKQRMTPNSCKKILEFFDEKYKFDDIFFWVN